MSINKITALVPTRKGSQRVKSKNTRRFSDSTLLDVKLKVLSCVSNIDEIIVNTDCEKSIAIAEKYDVKIHVREPYYASSEVTNNNHWKHLADVTDADNILLAQVTSPLIKASTYKNAIDLFINSDHDSLNSVSLEKKFLWKDNAPINYDASITPRSQDLPDIYSLSFAITLISKYDMLARENVVGANPKFIMLDKIESIDIDDIHDFKYAEFMYTRFGLNNLLG
jgi:CMP-N,N'-diacetyllegionaminic acid synthase